MAILTKLTHVTRYIYDKPVTLGAQIVRLRPALHSRSKVTSYALKVTPENHYVSWQQDPHANWLARFVFADKTRELSISVDLTVDMEVINPFDFFTEDYAEKFPFAYPPDLGIDLAPYLVRENEGPLFHEFLAGVSRASRSTTEYIVALNQKLNEAIGYEVRLEPGVQTPDETLQRRIGSCRDSAWLLVQLFRHLGLAARFVSGYLIQLRPDVKSLDGPSGAEVDFADLHAWCEVYIPGAGWIGLDPTSGLLCGEGHIPLAATPHFRSAAPITGGFSSAPGTNTAFEFQIRVDRIGERPRVTYPFTREAWEKLNRIGERTDRDLAAGDVRLTMGVAPTFVSIDDYQSAEWNTAVTGPTKRIRADDLIRRLAGRFAPGGFVHQAEGEPPTGESLPPWDFSLYWRKDGKPVWTNLNLIAGEAEPISADAIAAGEMVRAIARHLAPGRSDPESAENHRSGAGDQSGDAMGSALMVEPRDGRLCVYMPPTETLDEYLEILAAVESAARDLDVPVRIEGCPPPADPRLAVIRIAPDRGVIKVDIQPAASWTECVAVTSGVFEEARLSRLGTDKFMTDGLHTGTGAGNHLVAGGATPADSPFLRRPDLLKSLVLYCQRHPSLSYLFSGLFVGPAGPAPRIDEARQDGLYELEIALAQLPAPGEDPPPPELTDGLFRNLLADVTGDPDRAEICVDRLSPPDPANRLGLVEFRAFEMPPHARMSLAQQLLLRALIAWFWREPLQGRFSRWGTDLHDRFMLEHFVWADFLDVLRDLGRAGYDLEPTWFEAQRAFRFPRFGTIQRGGVSLEVRGGLEPWHLTAAERTASGWARQVDSSVERLQVKVDGLDPNRHVIACNGRRVPMIATGTNGQFVGGIRFKARQSASGIHPLLPVSAPLTFDVVDLWSKRSLGGCVYHAAHPAGRSHDTFPVNAYEAEARRLTRFQAIGHSIGEIDPPPEERPGAFPATLDLRRPAGI